MTNVPTAEGIGALIGGVAAFGVLSIGPLLLGAVLAAASTRWRGWPFPLTAAVSLLTVGILTPLGIAAVLWGAFNESTIVMTHLKMASGLLIGMWILLYGALVVVHLSIPISVGTLIGWLAWEIQPRRGSYAAGLGWIAATSVAIPMTVLAPGPWVAGALVVGAGPIGAVVGGVTSDRIESTPLAIPTASSAE